MFQDPKIIIYTLKCFVNSKWKHVYKRCQGVYALIGGFISLSQYYRICML